MGKRERQQAQRSAGSGFVPRAAERASLLDCLRFSSAAAQQGPVAPPRTASEAANEELQGWMGAVLQPSDYCYDGHGVARPSAFIKAGPRFRRKFEELMADHGGPGSWMWKKLPKEALSQGTPREVGGRAAEVAREAAAREEAQRLQARRREQHRRAEQRMQAVASEFRPSVQQPQAKQAKGEGVEGAREQAMRAYRLLKAARGKPKASQQQQRR